MSRLVTLAGYALAVLALAACEVRARRHDRPTARRLVAGLAAWPPTRWALLAGWLWLGWHLFARGPG